MLEKIDIKFQHDWTSLINKFQRISDSVPTNNDVGKFIEGFNNKRYDFGTSGSYIYYTPILTPPDKAASLNGKIVESGIPWIQTLKDDLRELGLVGISFQGNFGSLQPHIDGQESKDTVYHCKLNYIIDNYDACSYVQDGDVILEYPSIKDSAWLLDTTKMHWVNGNGQRYLFQLTFHQKHSEVLEWFKNHPNLSYK